MISGAELDTYFENTGLRPFTQAEQQEYAHNYLQQLRQGLTQNPSNLPMYKTALETVDLQPSWAGKQVLVTDIGGTNIYWGLATVQPHPEGSFNLTAYNQEPFATRQFPSADVFYQTIASKFAGIAEVLGGKSPDALAIVYSFPGEGVRNGRRIDITPDRLTKGFVIPGMFDRPVGATMLDTLRHTYTFIDPDLPILVANDTPTVMASHPDANLGLVVGTGFNIAGRFDGLIRNTESGNSSPVPQHLFAREYDQISTNPEQNLTEKQVAGDPVGYQFERYMRALQELGHLGDLVFLGEFSGRSISNLLANQFDQITSEGLGGNLDKANISAMQRVATTLRLRSATLVGIQLATIVNNFPKDYPGESIVTPAEGSFIWGVPGYSTLLEEVFHKFSGKRLVLENIPNAGMRGAVKLALSLAA